MVFNVFDWHYLVYFVESGVIMEDEKFDLDELCAAFFIGAMMEREACAALCEDHFSSDGDWCAKQIRSRSCQTSTVN